MSSPSPLSSFLALYAALFAAFGVASPFLPGLLMEDGLDPKTIGFVLASGTAIRLVAGPVGGRLADRSGLPSSVLTALTAAAALIALGYSIAETTASLLLVSVAHATVLAPLTPVADALTLGSAQAKPGFQYGWVRGAGSAAFIVGTIVSGQVVGYAGLGAIVWLNSGLLAVSAVFTRFVPNRVVGNPLTAPTSGTAGAIWTLLSIPLFRRLMVVVALIGGSHALHDTFEVIRWRAAGLSTSQASLLWASSVASEVLVFLFLGRRLLLGLGPGRCLILAGAAGIIRWGAAAQTAWFPIMVIVEPLHGLTFALLHLASMDMIVRIAPRNLAVTAQAFYATIAVGGTSVCVTVAAGLLYENWGATAFWAMAAMCAIAMPIASRIRSPST